MSCNKNGSIKLRSSFVDSVGMVCMTHTYTSNEISNHKFYRNKKRDEEKEEEKKTLPKNSETIVSFTFTFSGANIKNDNKMKIFSVSCDSHLSLSFPLSLYLSFSVSHSREQKRNPNVVYRWRMRKISNDQRNSKRKQKWRKNVEQSEKKTHSCVQEKHSIEIF